MTFSQLEGAIWWGTFFSIGGTITISINNEGQCVLKFQNHLSSILYTFSDRDTFSEAL